MFWQRVVTALLLLPAVIYLVFGLPLHFFAPVLAAVLLIGAWEWSKLALAKNMSVRMAFVLLVALIQFLIAFLSPPIEFWPSLSWPIYSGEIPISVLFIAAIFWLVSPALLYVYPQKKAWWRGSSFIRFVLGVVLLTALWIALISLRKTSYDSLPTKGSWLILFVLLLVWAADTGAYATGKLFGKHKLAPAVSPGKTWEGFFGGLVLSMIVAVIAARVMNIDVRNWAFFLLACLATVMASVVGDLFESLTKREAGLKDSGTIFPGHGGMLDRIDSLIAAAPIFALCALLLDIR